jgi:hypothetical protein
MQNTGARLFPFECNFLLATADPFRLGIPAKAFDAFHRKRTGKTGIWVVSLQDRLATCLDM